MKQLQLSPSFNQDGTEAQRGYSKTTQLVGSRAWSQVCLPFKSRVIITALHYLPQITLPLSKQKKAFSFLLPLKKNYKMVAKRLETRLKKKWGLGERPFIDSLLVYFLWNLEF